MIFILAAGEEKPGRMAPTAKISDAEWQMHKATIRRLYIDRVRLWVNLYVKCLVVMASRHRKSPFPPRLALLTAE